ncbi:hypothetical protein [Streptomyces sp. NPDC002057]|uniref:hypothetical protein n=1 Tax=Streptomyces sp. NPDC002057 TaxID=3154664 RepID=UPI00331BFCE1
MTTTDDPAESERSAGVDASTFRDRPGDAVHRRGDVGPAVPAALLTYRKPGWIHPDHRQPAGTP